MYFSQIIFHVSSKLFNQILLLHFPLKNIPDIQYFHEVQLNVVIKPILISYVKFRLHPHNITLMIIMLYLSEMFRSASEPFPLMKL